MFAPPPQFNMQISFISRYSDSRALHSRDSFITEHPCPVNTISQTGYNHGILPSFKEFPQMNIFTQYEH